jgi:hypothetical protein
MKNDFSFSQIDYFVEFLCLFELRTKKSRSILRMRNRERERKKERKNNLLVVFLFPLLFCS